MYVGVNRASTDDAAAGNGDELYQNMSEVFAANNAGRHHHHHHHHHYHYRENHEPRTLQQADSATDADAGGGTHHTAVQPTPSVS